MNNNITHMVIGYIPGVFDCFHAGHKNILTESSRRCDKLIVGCHTDEFVMTYKRKPRDHVLKRIDNIRSFCQDAIVCEVGGHHLDLIRKYNIRVIFHGTDWKLESYKKQIRYIEDGLDIMGVEIVFIPYTKGISTTAILSNTLPSFENVRTVIFDLDNTLMLGDRVLPYASECVKFLRKRGCIVLVMTNNNRRTPPAIQKRIQKSIGCVDGVYTSLHEVRSNMPSLSKCVGWGTPASLEWLGDVPFVSSATDTSRDTLILLYRHDYTSDDLRHLCTWATRVNTILVGNIDTVYPSDDSRIWPDTGALLELILSASKTTAKVVRCGKPSVGILPIEMKRPLLVVGDRAETDGELARKLDASFIHVGVKITHLGVLMDYFTTNK